MKVLNEYNDNDYARRIHEVEELMRKNEVSISYIGGFHLVKIKNQEYKMNSSEFPRLFEEDKLELYIQ